MTTDFETLLILAEVRQHPNLSRANLAYRIGDLLKRPDHTVVLAMMDALENEHLIHRFNLYSGYHITPWGEGRLFETRNNLQSAMNLINATY